MNLREMAISFKDLRKSIDSSIPRSSHEIGVYDMSDKDVKVVVKFPNDFLYDKTMNPRDKELHVLVELLSYQIYKIFGVQTPEIVDFVLHDNGSIGLASSFVKGNQHATFEQLIGSDFAYTFLVHAFLANWDVGGGWDVYPNILFNPVTEKWTVIDPGGSLTFRARGARKGPGFSGQVGELETMQDDNMSGMAAIFRGQKILKRSFQMFRSVSWAEIQTKLDSFFEKTVQELQPTHSEIAREWEQEYKSIMKILRKRYNYIIQQERSLT